LEEAARAAQLLHASVRANLQLPDGFFEHNQANLLEVIKMIRFFQPRIVLANSITDRHPDHGKAAKLVADACFYAGLPKIQTTWDTGAPQQAWRPEAVYHYIQDYNLKPDFVVDISAYMEKKLEVILCFRSQFYDPNSTEPQTPISGKDFLDFLRGKAKAYGRAAGFEYAEGFNVNRSIGVTNLFDLR
jgi:bacillithiol biosynthesis deacetylase BshB1